MTRAESLDYALKILSFVDDDCRAVVRCVRSLDSAYAVVSRDEIFGQASKGIR